jgi:hypothetical protein
MQSPSADRLQAIRDARNQIPNAKQYQYAYALKYLFGLVRDENPLESLHDLRLAKNDFRVTSDLDEYRKGFGDTFNHKLTQLQGRIGGRWLDGGAGEARAMIEFLNTSPHSDAECVAMSVQRPASAEITLAERTYGDRFRYIDGKLFDAFTSKELGTNTGKLFDLITDMNGVLYYTKTPAEDLLRYMNLLKDNGILAVSTSALELRGDLVTHDGKVGDFGVLLRNVRGATCTAVPKKGTFILARNPEEEISLPPLKLVEFTPSKDSNASLRVLETNHVMR